MSLRAIVCGGRTFSDAHKVNATLDAWELEHIAHGGASGADALADAWARERCATTAHPYAGVRLEVHHVLGRQPVELVNEPENLLVLCKRFGREPGCHDWWHANKRRALEWFVQAFGEERLARLRAIQQPERVVSFSAGGVPPAGSNPVESHGCSFEGRPVAARGDDIGATDE